MFDLSVQPILPGASHSHFSYGQATLQAEPPSFKVLFVTAMYDFHCCCWISTLASSAADY